MIQCSCTKYAVMNALNEIVYTSSGRAFYKTKAHADKKVERCSHYGGDWRVVEVYFKEVADDDQV